MNLVTFIKNRAAIVDSCDFAAAEVLVIGKVKVAGVVERNCANVANAAALASPGLRNYSIRFVNSPTSMA